MDGKFKIGAGQKQVGGGKKGAYWLENRETTYLNGEWGKKRVRGKFKKKKNLSISKWNDLD